MLELAGDNMVEEILKIEHVSKKYRLGMIGGTTLRDELQRRRARRKGIEDPTAQVGGRQSGNVGDEFYALNDISFSVEQGERVGVIGHNGAGKSTLLKLISRITVPTTGSIEMNGRIASMLEVGTGFHPELSGRENIYMNGAILGMTKAEIDKKIEDIIDFSECRQFIDTPVKRYSSGMYVKLAFSVAAHLDSEIMIMDEVLAVGDMAFQRKCIEKMSQISRVDGRTILYVSHNMNTIRQLCSRCIVLDHGHVVFNGDVEEAISIYMDSGIIEECNHYDYSDNVTSKDIATGDAIIKSLDILDKKTVINYGEKLRVLIQLDVKRRIEKLQLRFIFININGTPVATTTTEGVTLEAKDNQKVGFELDVSHLAPSKYLVKIIAVEIDDSGIQTRHDRVAQAFVFTINEYDGTKPFKWDYTYWGGYSIDSPMRIDVSKYDYPNIQEYIDIDREAMN
jgi:lipopolysaccharide transport system ATP-binding protein